MTNIKIAIHCLPHEIDYLMLTYIQLKKSKYHLSSRINVTIETCLNLSSYLINWEESKLPKEFFINKYNQIANLLEDYNHINKIYDGDKLYGHLDLQKEIVCKEADYYMGLCPDIYFSEYLLSYMIEAAIKVPNKYFNLIPQTSKLSDQSWDEITDKKWMKIPYEDCYKQDTFDIRYHNKIDDSEREIIPVKNLKFGGWFDLMNKGFYEDLVPLQKSWSGYGPYDTYSMYVCHQLKQIGVDYQQYMLKGETIFGYGSGPLKGENVDGFKKYYQDMIVMNDIPNQRAIFESKMGEYLNESINLLKDKNII